MFAGRTLVVVDTETTGFDPAQGHELVEVACITLTDGRSVSEWSSLVRPSRPIPAEASAVHGITDAMTATAPGPSEVAARLRSECADHALVFHHAAFDLPFLRALLRGGGQPPLTAPVLDTLGVARALFGSGGNSLGALAKKLSLPAETAHRALGDARTTARAMLALVERYRAAHGEVSFDELAALSQDQIRLTRGRPTSRV